MLRSLKLRTKLALIVVIPMIAAVAIAVPGFRSRRHDLDAVSNARALLEPATTVSAYLRAVQDEGSLSAWWVASGDPAVKPRLQAARVVADRAARQLPAAADAADAHGAPEAASRIRALNESVMLLSQERQFVDLRITPDDAALGYYRDLDNETTTALDAFVRAPRSAVAVTMFRDLATVARLESGAADERSILAVAYSRLVLGGPARVRSRRRGHPAGRVGERAAGAGTRDDPRHRHVGAARLPQRDRPGPPASRHRAEHPRARVRGHPRAVVHELQPADGRVGLDPAPTRAEHRRRAGRP